MKIDLRANVHWTEADNDRAQWRCSGRDVDCYRHINKLQKWKSGIFKSANLSTANIQLHRTGYVTVE